MTASTIDFHALPEGVQAFDSPLLTGIFSDVYNDAKQAGGGIVADYIPALRRADPKKFGMAITANDGETWKAGDADVPFTIQSVSKPLTLLAALEADPERVFKRVGVEPSGREFSSLQLNHKGQPFNPLINAGAIAVAGVLHDYYGDDAKPHVMEFFSTLAGHPLVADGMVYESERQTGHRNLALAHLLHDAGIITDVQGAYETHTFACSISVTAEDLSVMAATLACMGRNPITDDVVADQTAVRNTLSLIATCGMYEASGQWLLEVGIPAKSGVSGDLLGIVNRQMGIGMWSPPLDLTGNSVRAVQACRMLSDELALHHFAPTTIGSDVLQMFMSRK